MLCSRPLGLGIKLNFESSLLYCLYCATRCHAKPPRQDSRHITSAASRFPPFEMARRVGFPAKGIRHISRWTQLLARQLQHTVNTTSHSTQKMLDNSRSSIFKVFKIKGFIFVRTTRCAYIAVLTYKDTGYLESTQECKLVTVQGF